MPAFGPADISRTPMSMLHRMRLLAIAATALALGLTGWRTFDILTKPASTPDIGSAYEQELLALIEPITGRGAARLKLRRSETGARNFLVLVDGPDTSTSPYAERLETLITSAVGLDRTIGDTIDIQQFPFAASVSLRPSRSELAELASLGLLTLLLGLMAFMPARGHVAAPSIPARRDFGPEPSPIRQIAPAPVEDVAPTQTVRASHAVARDPAAAASILRQWMKSGRTAA